MYIKLRKVFVHTSLNHPVFICFVLQNEKYTNICEKKFSKAQERNKVNKSSKEYSGEQEK